MEAAAKITLDLEGEIAGVLRESDAPLRAIDIVRKLAESDVVATTAALNKILYKGPFDRAAGTGTPKWTLRPEPKLEPKQSPFLTLEGMFSFQVDGVGFFSLQDSVSEAHVAALLRTLAALVPAEAAKTIRPNATAGGKMVARLAPDAGFAVLEGDL
jgi:hypothetical protein